MTSHIIWERDRREGTEKGRKKHIEGGGEGRKRIKEVKRMRKQERKGKKGEDGR